jgi:hypothetical protein
MERMQTTSRQSALVTLGALALLAALPNSAEAQQQQQPPPEGYTPPQQVYTVDVYEQPYVPPPPQAQPNARPRRVVIPYEDGMEVPPGAYVRSRSRKGLWIPGLAIFAAGYFFTGIIGSLAMDIGGTVDQRIWVPLVGGLLVADRSAGRTASAFSTLMQGAGLTMLIAGLASRRRELVYYTDSGRGLMFGATPLPGGAYVSLNVF